MTRDEIVRLAHEVGILMRSHEYQDEPTKLEKFAELVSAHDTALFNELLNLLGPTAPTCCGCSAEWQKAIDLIKKQLRVEK